MNRDRAWKLFALTGQPIYYLNYKRGPEKKNARRGVAPF